MQNVISKDNDLMWKALYIGDLRPFILGYLFIYPF